MPAVARKIEYEVNESGCFICTSHAPNRPNGYPRITIKGRRVLIDRIVYEERHGPLPLGMIVRHRCDVPACINPDHLEPGTQYDNVQDRVVRGRSRYAAGELHGLRKLTAVDVSFIRSSDKKARELAALYGVGKSAIDKIRQRVTWRNV